MTPIHAKKSTTRTRPNIGVSRTWAPTHGSVATMTPTLAMSAACAPADYALPGVFPARKQADADTSWATQVAILLAWRDDTPYTEEQALAKIGPQWVERLTTKRPLTDDETALLLGSICVCTPPPQLLSSDAWSALLRLYGPIAIADGDVATVKIPSRGRIVFGVRGDGMMNGTTLSFVDTNTGDVAQTSLEKLGGPYRLLHLHADAGLACGHKPTAPMRTQPAVSHGPTVARESSRWRGARELSTPDWDRPSNFPKEIRAFWAKLDSRLHHHVWHDARANWPNLAPGVQRAFDRLGFTPPPRTVGAPGSGVDFLNMHRQMMSATRALALSLGRDYRPLGWNPIPWEHGDAVWPMPAWPGFTQERFKTREITGFWRAQVSDKLTNDAVLAGMSLDELGQQLENGIHNWMHMHWSTPAPSNAELQRADPSNDWLGSTFSSHVNPIFWKLHGWIDQCIERWENAPLAVRRARRSAAEDLKKFNWLGPVPQPPAVAKSMEMHQHGSTISEAELQDIVSAIDFTARPSFPFASLPREQLVARFGDVAPLTIAELEEIEPRGGSRMASLRRGRRVVVGYERHGVRAMDGGVISVVGPVLAEKGIEWLVGELTKRADGTRFVVTSKDVVNAGLPEFQFVPWTRTRAEFTFHALYPQALPLINIDPARFTVGFVFEYNGHSIRAASLRPAVQKSTPITVGQFEIGLVPRDDTPQGAESVRVIYDVAIRWDPGVGDVQYDYTGRFTVDARGSMALKLDLTGNDRVLYNPMLGLVVLGHEAIASPTVTRIAPPQPVFFDKAKDIITPTRRQALEDWLQGLKTNGGRYTRLTNGSIPISVVGYASDTGDPAFNEGLSQRRAAAVAEIVKNRLGPGAQVLTKPQGERNPATLKPVENPQMMRVDVYFEVL